MGREVRRVPKDWQHPKRKNRYTGKEEYQPMFDEPFGPAMDEWYAGWKAWKPEEHDGNQYWELEGGPPDPEHYRPDWPEETRTHLMMYEDISEGTPISPAFETPEELARWLVDNGASAFGSSTGSYEFDAPVDMGTVATRRFEADIGATSFDTGDLISFRDLVSTWSGCATGGGSPAGGGWGAFAFCGGAVVPAPASSWVMAACARFSPPKRCRSSASSARARWAWCTRARRWTAPPWCKACASVATRRTNSRRPRWAKRSPRSFPSCKYGRGASS